ncbi:ribonuclease T2-like isoform X2 [Heptranchias perlo]|uniref:ribonuclease T2-like isoform X2 n=1 Tax=Heptranchias perlo TaxID=212740 RepID=UPI0035598C82
MALYAGICLTVLGLTATIAAQADMNNSCKWKCLTFAQLWPGSFCMDLQDDLLHYWPSLVKSSAFTFWTKEWSKHGTCATCADSMSCPHKYFSLALQLRSKLSIDAAFNAAGIKPSCNNSYTYEDLHSALSDLGTHVGLQCYYQEGRQILMQIKIPLSKDLSIGCNTPNEHFSRSFYEPCKNNAAIYFYPFTQHPHNPCP